MRIIASLIVLLFISSISFAQNFQLDTSRFNQLNFERINTNRKGMVVLGSWAAVNIASGTIGYFAAKDEEWKSFHEMNAIWNIANGVIAVSGFLNAKKELSNTISCNDQLHKYEATKRLYLINGGLDVLYIGAGAFLPEHGKSESNPDRWSGFGKSIALQGAFLLFFDSIMYASHQQKDQKWYALIQGLCVTGNGIGFRYTVN